MLERAGIMETIQEIIKKYNLTKDNQVYKEIIERIKTEELLWVSFMPATRNFYLDFEDEKATAYLFTEREFFLEYQEFMKHRKIEVKAAEVKKDQRMLMFGEMFRSGFELLMINSGQTPLLMSLFDVVEKPDFSALPENKRPTFNPALVCAANHFVQEENIRKADPDLEEIMFKELYHAKYLMPVDTSKMNLEDSNTSRGEEEKKEKGVMQFPLITNLKKERYFPMFTDWNEFKRFDPQQKLSANIVSFKDIKFFVNEADGVAINPFGFNIILEKDKVEKIESIGKGLSQDSTGKDSEIKQIVNQTNQVENQSNQVENQTKVELEDQTENQKKDQPNDQVSDTKFSLKNLRNILKK